MHARNRTWALGSDPVERCRQRTLPVEGGDGSTLSLDFTTGVLDPRLTFSRSTNATFINSSGLVQYADANLLAYSETMDNSPWAVNGVTNDPASVTNPIGGTSSRLLTVSASGGSKSLAGQMTIAQGFQYTFRIWVRAGTASSVSIGFYFTTFQLCTLTKVSGDGTISGSGTGALYQTITGLTSNWTLLQVTLATTTTAGSGQWYIYPNTPSPQAIGDSIYVWGAQCNIGGAANQYYRTTTAAYQAPRFDYDPTSIGTPRGLLIEGTANQLLTYSEDYSQAVWTKVTVDRTTGQNSPDGGTGATLISENATTYAKHDLERSQTITAGIHTFSVWVKEPSTNSRRYVCLQLADGQATAARYTIVADLQTGTITATGSTNGTAGAPTGTGHSITPYRDGWYRLTITMNHVASPCYPVVLLSDVSTLFGGNNQPFYSASSPYKGLIVWGAQLETGSGASSYIPTGASTGSRAADSCVMTGTNFSSWFAGATEGVLYTQFEKPRSQSGTIGHDHASVGYQYGSGTGFTVYSAYNNYYPTTLLWPTGGAIFPGGIASAVPAVTKQAGKWFGGNDATNYANGVQGTTSAGTGTLAPNMLSIGANSASGTAATRDWLNACVRSVKFWPVALPDSQIISLTT